jgi:phosphomannomutase
VSGTEPLIRCYAEADSDEEVGALLRKGLEAVR